MNNTEWKKEVTAQAIDFERMAVARRAVARAQINLDKVYHRRGNTSDKHLRMIREKLGEVMRAIREVETEGFDL